MAKKRHAEFKPEWTVTDPVTMGLLESCWAADRDDLTPQLILADRLNEIGHPSEKWIRLGCALWEQARTITHVSQRSSYKDRNRTVDRERELAKRANKAHSSWFLMNLINCLVVWHAPAGGDPIKPMGRTFNNTDLDVAQRWCWWRVTDLTRAGQMREVRRRVAAIDSINTIHQHGHTLYWQSAVTGSLVRSVSTLETATSFHVSVVTSLVGVARWQAYISTAHIPTCSNRVWDYAIALWDAILVREDVKALL